MTGLEIGERRSRPSSSAIRVRPRRSCALGRSPPTGQRRACTRAPKTRQRRLRNSTRNLRAVGLTPAVRHVTASGVWLDDASLDGCSLPDRCLVAPSQRHRGGGFGLNMGNQPVRAPPATSVSCSTEGPTKRVNAQGPRSSPTAHSPVSAGKKRQHQEKTGAGSTSPRCLLAPRNSASS
jgi:hypothetical protein